MRALENCAVPGYIPFPNFRCKDVVWWFCVKAAPTREPAGKTTFTLETRHSFCAIFLRAF
jgi:hypothetical protein